MGIAAYYAGRWDEAHALYRRSREAKERAGDVVRAATGANNEAEILLEQGHLDQAEALLREALRVWSAAGYQLGTALATSNLGRLQALAGRLAEAGALLDEARERFDAIGARGFVLETDARRAECCSWRATRAAPGGSPGEPTSASTPRVGCRCCRRRSAGSRRWRCSPSTGPPRPRP